MHLKMSSVKWRSFCPGGDELIFGNNWGRGVDIDILQMDILIIQQKVRFLDDIVDCSEAEQMQKIAGI